MARGVDDSVDVHPFLIMEGPNVYQPSYARAPGQLPDGLVSYLVKH